MFGGMNRSVWGYEQECFGVWTGVFWGMNKECFQCKTRTASSTTCEPQPVSQTANALSLGVLQSNGILFLLAFVTLNPPMPSKLH